MPEIHALCHICGKIAEKSCRICGRPACALHIKNGVCDSCRIGKN